LDGRPAFRSIGRRIGRSGSESGIDALKVERFLAKIS
jgi:hypothetical protein